MVRPERFELLTPWFEEDPTELALTMMQGKNIDGSRAASSSDAAVAPIVASVDARRSTPVCGLEREARASGRVLREVRTLMRESPASCLLKESFRLPPRPCLCQAPPAFALGPSPVGVGNEGRASGS